MWMQYSNIDPSSAWHWRPIVVDPIWTTMLLENNPRDFLPAISRKPGADLFTLGEARYSTSCDPGS